MHLYSWFSMCVCTWNNADSYQHDVLSHMHVYRPFAVCVSLTDVTNTCSFQEIP